MCRVFFWKNRVLFFWQDCLNITNFGSLEKLLDTITPYSHKTQHTFLKFWIIIILNVLCTQIIFKYYTFLERKVNISIIFLSRFFGGSLGSRCFWFGFFQFGDFFSRNWNRFSYVFFGFTFFGSFFGGVTIIFFGFFFLSCGGCGSSLVFAVWWVTIFWIAIWVTISGVIICMTIWLAIFDFNFIAIWVAILLGI